MEYIKQSGVKLLEMTTGMPDMKNIGTADETLQKK